MSLHSFQVFSCRFEVRVKVHCLLHLLPGLVFVALFFKDQSQPPVRRRKAGLIPFSRLGQIETHIFFGAVQLRVLVVHVDDARRVILWSGVIGNGLRRICQN